MAKKKTAVKKAAPKPKLIEGKYALKILTRLIPSEAEILEKLKKDLNEKTFNGAFVKIITQFKNNNDELKDLRTKVMELEERNGSIIETIQDWKDVMKRMQEIEIPEKPKMKAGEMQCHKCKKVFDRWEGETWDDGKWYCDDHYNEKLDE